MSIVLKAWKRAFCLDPKISIVEWSNTYRYLSSEGACEHGKYNMNRMPFLVEIAEHLSPQSPIQFVFVCKGVQLGFTELGNNMLFTYADLYPCPMLVVFPVKNLLKQHLDNKFWSGIRVTPRLAAKIKPVKQGSINSSSSTFIKFNGGSVVASWSESKSTFASGSYRVAHLSDLDRFPDDVGGEGDTVALASKRLNSFGSSRKMFGESSPTKKANSKIDNEVQNGDQNRYFMNCPECNKRVTFLEKFFIYEWDRQTYELIGDVKFSCNYCGSLLSEYDKDEMMKIENGAKWIPTNPSYRNKVRKTYYIGAYYSPFLTWNEIFTEKLEALKELEVLGRNKKMKAWYNTIDGTVYEEPTDYKAIPLDVQELLDRREDYNRVPNDVVLLSAGVDTQGDRFEVTVLGWKSSREKYLIAHYVIMGDPATVSTQKKLDELLFTKFFATECGGEMKIFCSAIDTQGNKTDYIYRYVQQRRNKKIYAIKGGRNIDDPLVNTFTDTTTKGKGNLKLWVLGVNSGKDDIMEDLREEFGTRYIHFPRNMKHFYGTKSDKYSTSDNDYFTQLLVEKLDINGRWQNEFRRRNEALDCMNYANASVKIVKGLDINKIVSAGIKAYYRKPEE